MEITMTKQVGSQSWSDNAQGELRDEDRTRSVHRGLQGT
jgi:hypothetical protein